jgi:hypothetical protein
VKKLEYMGLGDSKLTLKSASTTSLACREPVKTRGYFSAGNRVGGRANRWSQIRRHRRRPHRRAAGEKIARLLVRKQKQGVVPYREAASCPR